MYSNTGSVSEHVGWIRRELLLKKASSGDISRVLPALSEMRSDDLQRIVLWLPGSVVADGTSPSSPDLPHPLNLAPVAVTSKDLHLDHWPEVVRKMAVHLKGLVEGVLEKKAAALVGRHERAGSPDSDLTL